jgi:virulence factor Mce-like protein
METKAPTTQQLVTIVVFVLICFGVGLFVWRTFGGTTPLQAKGYQVHVLFGSEGTQLTQGSDVRIAGVSVGEVTGVRTRDERVDATVQLESRYAPMPRDTRAIVRYKTLLGESYVELTPGTRGGPALREGDTLALGNVHPKQTVDEVLSTFDAPTRARFKEFMGDMNVALRDRGDDLNAVLGNAAPASEDLGRLAMTLDAEAPALRALVRDSATALQTVADRTESTQRLVRSGDAVFATTASRDHALTDSIRALPPFLSQLRTTLREVDATGTVARPVFARLRPVAPLLKPALEQTAALAPTLRSTFSRLDPIVRMAGRTIPPLAATVADARRAMHALAPAGRQLVPVLQLLERYRHETVAAVANTASASQEKLNGHHALRILLTVNNEGVFGQQSRQGSFRSNPYPAPGSTVGLAEGRGAFTCAEAANPTYLAPTSSPPCVEQPPWRFQGRTAAYPRLHPNRR